MATPFDKRYAGQLSTEDEAVVKKLEEAWKLFTKLKGLDEDDFEDFFGHIRDMTRIIASRDYIKNEIRKMDKEEKGGGKSNVPFPEYGPENLIVLCVLHGKKAALGKANPEDYKRGSCIECKNERS